MIIEAGFVLRIELAPAAVFRGAIKLAEQFAVERPTLTRLGWKSASATQRWLLASIASPAGLFMCWGS